MRRRVWVEPDPRADVQKRVVTQTDNPVTDTPSEKYMAGLNAEQHGNHVCGGCGKEITKEEFINSLWGECKDCENERIGDVCAG